MTIFKDTYTKSKNFFNRLWKNIAGTKKAETNVYFISGMCYNCLVFDKIILPHGYRKIYIEWLMPLTGEKIQEYAIRMASEIDTSHPFILIGYSFGGVIVQEMNTFLTPFKTVIISSFKKEEEIPSMFKAVSRANLWERIPERLYNSTDFITDIFNRFVYHVPNSELADYMTVTEPSYVKWAVRQITSWKPTHVTPRLYHIHGTEDQIFDFELIHNAFPVEGGDHLMVIKKADIVNLILGSILLINESTE